MLKALAAVALGTALCSAQTKEVDRTVNLDPHGSVIIDSLRGSVHITTWDRADVEIKARVEAAGSSSEDMRRFRLANVGIDSSADSVHIRTEVPTNCCGNDSGRNPDVHYAVRVPRTARLRIHDHASHIEIEDLSGPLDLVTHRGDADVDFAAFQGPSRVETHRGKIELRLPRDSRFDLESTVDRKSSLHSSFSMLATVGRRIQGTVNGGGPRLELVAEKGNINLRAK
jgi:putative adhesin